MNSTVGKTILAVALCASFISLSVTRAEQEKEMDSQGSQAKMITVVPADIVWGNVPPALPPGAMIAVLEGDPFKPGPYSLRLKLPADYGIPAHWHTMAERVTVISGTMNAGMGDKLDKEQSKAFPAGSYVSIPAKMHHFAWADGETIVQINGDGPFDINYIDPASDPRKNATDQKP